jgi:hypothetical protein
MQEIIQNSPNMETTRIYLRGVDLVGLLNSYFKGEFANMTTPIKINTDFNETKPQSIITVNQNNHQKSYRLDFGSGQYSACLGHKVYDTKGNYGPLDPDYLDNYNCMYCLRSFEELENISEVMGIPIRRTTVKDTIHYHMIDIFCCIRCMYAEYKRRHTNQLYSQSMPLISEIYTKMTGKDPSSLRPSSDPRLLQIMNGPMTWDEYHENDEIYPEVPGNVFFVPVIEYLGQMS